MSSLSRSHFPIDHQNRFLWCYNFISSFRNEFLASGFFFLEKFQRGMCSENYSDRFEKRKKCFRRQLQQALVPNVYEDLKCLKQSKLLIPLDSSHIIITSETLSGLSIGFRELPDTFSCITPFSFSRIQKLPYSKQHFKSTVF